MKTLKILTSIMVLLFLITMLSGMAIAGAPPVVPQKPTPVPQAPPSGGGDAPSYTAPSFQPYTIELHSSDGTITGSLNGVDYSTVRVNAAGSGLVNGENHTVAIVADLSNKPSDATLDIDIGSEGNLPAGMDGVVSISSVSIKGQSGWPLKSGTANIRFSVPSTQVEAGSDTKCYVVYYDGTNYHILTANMAVSDGMTTIEATVPSITGMFTAVISGSPKATAATTPVPTPGPTPVPTPEPTPAPSGIMGLWSSLWVGTFGTFAIGEAMGALILLVTGRLLK